MASDKITEDDSFEDASDNIDLESSIREVRTAMIKMLNNEFDEAKLILERSYKKSIYHALGLAVFEFIEAVLTFEPTQIQNASTMLDNLSALCDEKKHKLSLSTRLNKLRGVSGYNQYTEEECHTELILAESMLLKSILLIMEDESLVHFIKACMKIKTCINSYKECYEISKTYEWKNSYIKDNFDGGLKMGEGTFNLMMSMLPKKIVKLLEFVGYSVDKEKGLQKLTEGSQITNSIRQINCTLSLLSYNLLIVYSLTWKEGDLKLSEELLQREMLTYPKGVLFLMFKGRLEFMKGNFDEAITWYTRSWKSQIVWRQIHHMCFWELMWLHLINQNFEEALVYINHLIEESKWSRTIYYYIKGAILIKLSAGNELIEEALKNVPLHKKRLAGKSVPTEKFMIKRSLQYFEQNNYLAVPIYEVLYLYNLFHIVAKDVQALQRILNDIELEEKSDTNFSEDNKCLTLFLKGVALANSNLPLQAESCFDAIIKSEDKLKENDHLVPFTYTELALLQFKGENYEAAQKFLNIVKKKYAGFSLETKLHYKMHAIQIDLSEISHKKN